MLWDNLHANDYDQGRRAYLGPYDQPAELLVAPALAGILSNPNVQYECNFTPLATLALYVARGAGYEPDAAAADAVVAWLAAGGGGHSYAPLYIPFAILHTKQTGGHGNDVAARG